MPHKLKRNTKPATVAAAQNKRKRQKIVREIIRKGIFNTHCSCGKCENGDYSDLCISYNGIAKLANLRSLPTVSGKTGNWNAIQAVRLFPDSKHRYRDSNSASNSESQNEGKTSLEGLI